MLCSYFKLVAIQLWKFNPLKASFFKLLNGYKKKLAVFSLLGYAYINDCCDTKWEELGLDLLQSVRVRGPYVQTMSLPAMKFIQIVVRADRQVRADS